MTLKNYGGKRSLADREAASSIPTVDFFSWKMLYLLGKYTNIYKHKHYFWYSNMVESQIMNQCQGRHLLKRLRFNKTDEKCESGAGFEPVSS